MRLEIGVCATPSGSNPRRCALEETHITGTRSYPSDRDLRLLRLQVGLSSRDGKPVVENVVPLEDPQRWIDVAMRGAGISSRWGRASLARDIRTRSYQAEYVPCQSPFVRALLCMSARHLRGFGAVITILLATSLAAQAADLGTYGPLYEVEEPSLLQTIYDRLSEMEGNGELEEMKAEQQQRTRDYVKRPKPVSGLLRALEDVEWEVDLSITLNEDIADHRGVVFAHAGTVVNPLAFSRFNKRIVLFDGDDEEQLEYALSKGDELDTLLVLVNGDPLSLMREHGRRFYFDQQSVLTDRFGVRHVPAEITRGTHLMHVREIVVGGQP